jgi:hypothetical protein
MLDKACVLIQRVEVKEDDMALSEFKSLEDVHRYIQELSSKKAEEDRKVRFWRAVERVTLVIVLAGCLLNYYVLSIIEKIMALPHFDGPIIRATAKTTSALLTRIHV